ncbi:MAG TPA: hypothetical protein VHT91_00785 [Kofleriaceae bacterium]|jgi:hypothetical protein|nr:hypothetical protein [Kofleriaceae bacterium]
MPDRSKPSTTSGNSVIAASSSPSRATSPAPAQVADVLPEVAQGQLLRPLDRAVVGLVLAGDQPEHGGLAGAVGADQPDLLARVDLERGVDEQDLPTVLLADRAERDHVGAVYSTLDRRSRHGKEPVQNVTDRCSVLVSPQYV